MASAVRSIPATKPMMSPACRRASSAPAPAEAQAQAQAAPGARRRDRAPSRGAPAPCAALRWSRRARTAPTPPGLPARRCRPRPALSARPPPRSPRRSLRSPRRSPSPRTPCGLAAWSSPGVTVGIWLSAGVGTRPAGACWRTRADLPVPRPAAPPSSGLCGVAGTGTESTRTRPTLGPPLGCAQPGSPRRSGASPSHRGQEA